MVPEIITSSTVICYIKLRDKKFIEKKTHLENKHGTHQKGHKRRKRPRRILWTTKSNMEVQFEKTKLGTGKTPTQSTTDSSRLYADHTWPAKQGHCNKCWKAFNLLKYSEQKVKKSNKKQQLTNVAMTKTTKQVQRAAEKSQRMMDELYVKHF